MTSLPVAEHGGDATAVARALDLDPMSMLDLSMTVNPVAPELQPLLARHLDAVASYPDPTAATAALAGHIGVDVDQLLLTNGGSEAIALVAERFGAVSVDEPEFSLWRRHARIEVGAPRARSNPNNPTGLLADDDEVAAVWDEAFFPLATGRWTRGDDSIVVGSLTKLLACPGLRVGYIIGDPADIDALRARQPAWSVNGIACRALPAMLDLVDLPRWAASITTLRADLAGVLKDHGLGSRPSDAPWLLVDAPLRERLAPNGIVVRDCTSFGLPGVTRIAVPDERGLARLDQVLGAADVA